ncbi:MAG: hypothetical protein ACFNPZ_00770 [Fusobacterium polymorphum]
MEVSDWINLGTLVTTIIGLRFIYKQLKLTRKDYEAKFTYQKREKATEMAKEFEQFVVNSTFITDLLERTSLTKILSSLKINDNNKLIFEEFNQNEMEEILKQDKIEKVLAENKIEGNVYVFKEIYKIDYSIIAHMAQDFFKDNEYRKENIDYLASINGFKYFSEKELREKTDNKIEDKIKYNKSLSYFKKKLDYDMKEMYFKNLNKLEYIAMNFISDIADDKIVYNSLHQLFFSYVELNYFYIAALNSNGKKDKFYMNIIELYKKWKTKYIEDLIAEKNKIREINCTSLKHSKID